MTQLGFDLSRIRLNAARIIEGNCWQCTSPLARMSDGFGFCPHCDKAFRVNGMKVIERNRLHPEFFGAPVDRFFLSTDSRLISTDGKPWRQPTIQDGCWIEGTWDIPTL